MHLDANGRRIVPVSKQELIKTLQKNRESHQKQYSLAVDEYKKAAKKELHSLLRDVEEARGDVLPDLHIHLPRPVSYVKEYDRVITMLEMSVEETAQLSEKDVDRFIRDEWEWTEIFNANTASYSGVGRHF